MHIMPGAELTISLEDYDTPFKSIFVGEKMDKHIVAGLPDKLPFPSEALKKGCEALVRYSYKETLYEFHTRILEILKDPADLIILLYPPEINTVEKRTRKRVNCLIEAKFEIIFEDNNRFIPGIVENISKTGCNCVIKKLKDAERPFSLDDTITLRCQFPGFPGEQTAEGKIIRFQDKADEIRAGIRFNKELWWIPPYGPAPEDNTG